MVRLWAKSWKHKVLAETTRARSAPVVVYIQTAVFYSSLHIHHQIVHTSHFPIFSRPKLKPGGGVYLWGRNPHTSTDLISMFFPGILQSRRARQSWSTYQ